MYDVIISGCGPAGSNAAYVCASAGLKVLMIDRSVFPRSKCCAGGLLQRAQSLIPDFPSSLIEREIHGASFVMGDETIEIKSDVPVAVTVRRESFDMFLHNSALKMGAESLTAAVTKVKEKDDHVDVVCGSETLSSKVFICAEGASSKVAISLFGRFPPNSKATAFAQDAQVAKNPGNNFIIYTIGRSTSKPKLKCRYPSYGWVFPRNGSINIGVGGLAYPSDHLRKSLDAIRSHANDLYEISSCDEPSARPIPYAMRGKIVTKRCLAVGDSAGLASPLSGEGFTNAIKSGQCAGNAVVSCLEKNASLQSAYMSNMKKDVIPSLRFSDITARMIAISAAFCDVPSLIKNFSSDERIQDACIQFVRGECSWGKLLITCGKKLPLGLAQAIGHSYVPTVPGMQQISEVNSH